MTVPSAERIAEIREDHYGHVRSGWRCDCTVDLLAALDEVARMVIVMSTAEYPSEVAERVLLYVGAAKVLE